MSVFSLGGYHIYYSENFIELSNIYLDLEISFYESLWSIYSEILFITACLSEIYVFVHLLFPFDCCVLRSNLELPGCSSGELNERNIEMYGR